LYSPDIRAPAAASLVVEGRRYAATEVLAGAWQAYGHTPYAVQALQFSQDWLSGQNTFTLHTSGSTGQPKPIEVQRVAMQASALATGQALGLKAGMQSLIALNTAYVAGIMMLVRGWVLGLQSTLLPPAGNPFDGLAPNAHFDFTALVPLQAQKVMQQAPERFRGFKAIILGGAPVPWALEALLKNMEAPVYATFGMTETLSHIALRRLNGPAASAYFKALPGVELAQDARGCLRLRAAVTLQQWIQTNDLVTLRGADAFEWLGRADFTLNSGGVKVQTEKVERAVEQALHQIRANHRLFIFGAPHPELGQAVSLVLENCPDPEGLLTAIKPLLLKVLGPYEVPRKAYGLPAFVETPTGKIKKAESWQKVVQGL